jgi:ribonuclease J
MRACIHRGAAEIGGSCVELESADRRLVLDLGERLTPEAEDETWLPPIPGLLEGSDPSLLGLLISHGHPDHYGLTDRISPNVPVYIGEHAGRILNEATFFSPVGGGLDPSGFLGDQETLKLGPFRVTPYLVDHSAFDAYALLIEADGRRLFYTGDLRAHGRKPGTFRRLLKRPPEGVDVLLMEGTRLGRVEKDFHGPRSEPEVEAALLDAFRATEGMVLAMYSPQNVDRYVSVYKAAVRAGRDLAIDLYTAAIAAATGRETVPQADWKRIDVFVPQNQRIRVKKAEAFERVNSLRGSRIFPEDLTELCGRLVMTFRESMARDLERADCLAGASAIWSMWPGYLDTERGDRLRTFLDRHQIPLSVIHASGHATPSDLRRLAKAISPDRVVPIHTDVPERFAEYFADTELHPDGQWWEV